MTTPRVLQTPGARPASRARERSRQSERRFRPNWIALLLMLPALIVLGFVLFYPIGLAIYSSLFDMKLLNLSDATFIGLDNYRRMLHNPDFWHSLRVTVVYTAGTVVGSYAMGLLTALLLNRGFRGRAAARTLIILPWAVPAVVAVLVWAWMLDANYGVVNYLLRFTHLIGHNLPWRQRPDLALLSVLLVTIWTQYPIATVMLLAGLQGISRDLYEAAAVDGAGRAAQFRSITWPGLLPVNIVLILLLILTAFTRVVTIIYVMTGGGPSRATETLPIQTYLQAFKYFNTGYASALGTAVLVIAVAFTLVYLFVVSRINREV
ncbi:MAG: carbohydrate ABC transporter permease [Thermomicrobiales bacterium]